MLLNFDIIKKNKEILTYIKYSDYMFEKMGYKEHNVKHALFTAERAAFILKKLKYTKRVQELAKISGFLHDIGNLVSKKNHAQSSAMIVAHILSGLDIKEERYNSDLFEIFGAVGSHEEKQMLPPTAIAAAVVLGDKSDVRCQRLRIKNMDYKKDTHSKVIAACKSTEIKVSYGKKEIALNLEIDTDICSIMEYFEIFTTRTVYCSKAAKVLGCNFSLFINGYKFL